MAEGQGEIPIPQPIPERAPEVARSFTPLPTPIPEPVMDNLQLNESQSVTKLQVFLAGFNIPSDKLSPQLQSTAEELTAGVNSEGMDMADEEFRNRFGSFVDGIKDSKELNLNPEQQKQLEEVRTLIGSEEVQPRQVVDAIKGYVNSPEAQISPSEREEANTVIEEIREETTKGDKADVQKVSEKFGRLSKILKIIGAIILSLLGLGIFRAIKSERQ